MQQIEQLKQELIKQKAAIENKKGKVVVKNLNPSPSEITDGINTIINSDFNFTQATATEDSVLKGKTFFNSSGELKTGTFEDFTYTYFFYDQEVVDLNQTYDLVIPVLSIRDHLFHSCNMKLNVWLNPDTTKIFKYAFYGSATVLQNFSELKKLELIDDYAFYKIKGVTFDFPETLKILGEHACQNTLYNDASLTIPSSLTQIGTNCFACDSPTHVKELIFQKPLYLTLLPNSCFKSVFFDCDMIIPEGITKIDHQFCLFGSAKNIVLPTTLTSIGNQIFSNSSTSEPNVSSVTFLNPTPPTGTVITMLADIHRKKVPVYVPDNAVDDYKNAFKDYVITPLSQRPF